MWLLEMVTTSTARARFRAKPSKSQVDRVWEEPRLAPGSIPCQVCRQKITTKWVAWAPTGAITCNTNQCVAFAEQINGWKRYSEGLIAVRKPFPKRKPAPIVTAETVRKPRAPRARRQRSRPDRLADDLRKAAQNANRAVVTAPARRGWTCDGCGNRFPSRVRPVDVAGEQRCQDCL